MRFAAEALGQLVMQSPCFLRMKLETGEICVVNKMLGGDDEERGQLRRDEEAGGGGRI
jgi:hypothetical protein